ncbi:P-loop containing nucleoside triphosphate hydrolase protein [Desarmillaria ectypa]|nr:P-loop containing nucleoside triphosphate hydrolase protein [Desarmillaria ectypa]
MSSPHSSQGRRNHFSVLSRLSEPPSSPQSLQEVSTNEPQARDTDNYTIRRPISIGTPTPPIPLPSRPLSSSLTTPRPSLMFAIASDDVQQVRQVLEHGEASPNDNAGPQSALAFAITNNQLSQRLEIVKTLLAFGADTCSLNKELGSPGDDAKSPASALDQMDAATRYYISRTDAFLTRSSSTLMRRSSFRPLARIRFGIIGQDRALEQLFRVLSIHNNQKATAPIVILLCGPSGHGKSLLAQKFGPLLDVPTHTVNMTTLRSAHDLWQSYSISPYQDGSPCTLVEFLINNEGKRCVVVLDVTSEIEKTQDPSVLWSLLLPWELGRCSFEANTMNIDVHNTIWLGTSNIGQELVFEYHESLKHPEKVMSREEYVKLMSLLRPRVSERLGSSILSRVTTILPFVPFTSDETRAIASEALQSISRDVIKGMSSEVLTSVIEGSVSGSIPSEGARSLYRAVSNLLVDAMDLV